MEGCMKEMMFKKFHVRYGDLSLNRYIICACSMTKRPTDQLIDILDAYYYKEYSQKNFNHLSIRR